MKKEKDFNKLSKKTILWEIFKSTFLLSAFTFGGGYVIIPLMKKKFCDELHWIEEEEILNFVAIAQSSPGAVAVNASILLGFKILGFAGAVAAIVGTILPPMIILSVISFFYQIFITNSIVAALLKGMQAGVSAVIADVVINMGGKIIKAKEIISIIVMFLAFVCTYFFGVNVIFIILACAVIGGVTSVVKDKKKTASKSFEEKTEDLEDAVEDLIDDDDDAVEDDTVKEAK